MSMERTAPTRGISSGSYWPLVILVAAAQSLVLGYMVWDRVSLLTSGREVVLDVIPVDPRSLFRGDYVILNYKISRLGGDVLKTPVKRGDPIYVTLAKTDGGEWSAVAAAPLWPQQVGEGEIVLHGTVTRSWQPVRRDAGADASGSGASSPSSAPTADETTPASPPARATPVARVRYGLESYFVPEGAGLELEKKVADRKIQAAVSIDGKGRSALKALIVDGKRVHEQPWW